MANNTSEGEERIIALLTQLVENNSNADSDRLAQTANSLSTAAMTVSIVALVIGLLQALLQYASSNENHREKCNIGAIGRAAMLSGRSTWSWRHWRRMYTYPVLDFSVNRVFERLPGGKYDLERLEKIHKGTALPSLWPLVKNEPRQEGVVLQWRETKRSKGRYEDSMTRYWPWQLYYHGQTTRKAVSEDLSLIQRLRWHWYALFQCRNEKLSPRATWAQLLEALNIEDIKPLVTRRMDAECIASSVDVATQKIGLQDLELSWQLVRVARFLLKIYPALARWFDFKITLTLNVTVTLTSGFVHHFFVSITSLNFLVNFAFGETSGIFRDESRTGASSPRDWWHRTPSFRDVIAILTNYQRFCLDSLPVIHEAELWDKMGNLPNWRGELRSHSIMWPSMFLAATIACIPGETTGFPSRTMLRPFLECLSQWATEVRDRCCLTEKPTSLERLQDIHWTWLDNLQREDLCVVTGNHVLEVYGICELSSWAFWQIDTQTLKEAELRLCGQPYNNPDEVCGFGRLFRQKNATSENTQETYRILDEVLPLLVKYEPDSWSAQTMQDQGPDADPKRPKNLLWTQVLLLDITIRELLISCPPGPSNTPGNPVWCINATTAVVDSWRDPNADWPLQHLDSFLIKTFDIDETDAKNQDRMVRLSNLIQLRALCFLAYLMIIPDSSDLYWAWKKEKVMLPMI